MMCGLVRFTDGVILIVRCRSVLSIGQILQSGLRRKILHRLVKKI